MKWFWYEKMKPNVSRETVESWNSFESLPKFEWGQGIDGYYELCEDGLKKMENQFQFLTAMSVRCNPDVQKHR